MTPRWTLTLLIKANRALMRRNVALKHRFNRERAFSAALIAEILRSPRTEKHVHDLMSGFQRLAKEHAELLAKEWR